MQHLAVSFHPARRAPGTGKQGELAARCRHYLLYERNAELLIVLHAESFQGRVLVGHVGIAVTRKVAAVNVGAGQRVANAGCGAVISLKKFLLLWLGQLGKSFGRGISQCPTNAEHGLEAVARVDEYAHLGFYGLPGGGEWKRLTRREALGRTGHCGIHTGRFASSRIGSGGELGGLLDGGAAGN